jgi:hypothetical protein
LRQNVTAAFSLAQINLYHILLYLCAHSAPSAQSTAGEAVAFGSTGYNLFLFDVATLTGTYIGTATSFSVSLVPAPGALSLLAFAGGACASRRRRA